MRTNEFEQNSNPLWRHVRPHKPVLTEERKNRVQNVLIGSGMSPRLAADYMERVVLAYGAHSVAHKAEFNLGVRESEADRSARENLRLKKTVGYDSSIMSNYVGSTDMAGLDIPLRRQIEEQIVSTDKLLLRHDQRHQRRRS